MAMDLFALHPASPGYARHLITWGRWTALRDLLVELAAPVGEMAFTNNGDIVTETTALRWAELLTGSEDRIFVVRYPDPGFASGIRVELHVSGTDTPVALTSAEVERALLRTDHPAEVLSDTPPATVALPYAPDEVAWLRAAASFFANSGGFHQY